MKEFERKQAQSAITWQWIQDWWESRVIPPEARTPETRFPRWYEEALEASEAFDNYLEEDTLETRKELALEMADTMIIGLGVISSLGFDIENLLHEKLERNHIKYNVVENGHLREDGMSWEEALAKQKGSWDLTR